MFNKRVLTPPASILPDATTTKPEQVPNLAPVLSQVIPSELVSVTAAPQTLTYNLNIINLSDLTKLSRLEKIATAITGRQCTLTTPGNGSHYSISVPRINRELVTLKQCLLTRTFDDMRTGLPFIAGKDQNNRTRAFDLARMPHCLIAGTTGSGKSVTLHTLICSLLYKHTPETLSFLMVDCKRIELSQYATLPHLYQPIVTDPQKAVETLKNLCQVMDQRYRKPRKDAPSIVIIIDELADLMLTSKKAVEPYLVRLAQLGRAAQIHMVLCTQKPSAAVVTGLISANIPMKICLKCAKVTDSVLILGHKGGESLTGAGDAIVKTPDTVTETRLQCPYTDPDTVQRVVEYWRKPDRAKRAS